MARAPKVTYERLRALIESGVGTGHGESYQPFLQIKRWNPSPVSTQVLSALPPYERAAHFFSLSEWCIALLAAWAGCWVREQFPLWPWPHPHPHYGLGDEWGTSLPWSIGMEALCLRAGIRHGVFPGTTIPYIWTLDLALSLPWVEDPAKRCAFVSIKPLESERYAYVDPLDRGVEKLEMERRYAEEMGIAYFVGDSSIFPNELWANLDWLRTTARPPTDPTWKSALERFVERYSNEFSETPLTELAQRLIKDYGLPQEAADYLIQHCLWNQIIDCDLSRYINTSRPAKPGGRRLIQQFRASLMKGFA